MKYNDPDHEAFRQEAINYLLTYSNRKQSKNPGKKRITDFHKAASQIPENQTPVFQARSHVLQPTVSTLERLKNKIKRINDSLINASPKQKEVIIRKIERGTIGL